MSNSPKLALPLWPAGALQPDLILNEDMLRLDALVQGTVIEKTLTAPPGSPVEGDRHIVAVGGTGLWAGKDNNIAIWLNSAWVFYAPQTGWCFYVVAASAFNVWSGSAWVASTSPPSGAAGGDLSGTYPNPALANIPSDVPMAGDLLATAIAAPATPAAGKGRIYVDSTSKNIAVKDDAGVVKHGVQTKAAVASNFVTAISDAGVVTVAQPVAADISGLGTVATLASDTDGTLAANSDTRVATQKATKTYADAGVAAAATDATTKANAAQTNAQTYADGLVVGLLDDRGNYDASTNLFPAAGGSGAAGAVLKGDLWTVSVGGTLGGTAVTIGDVVRAGVNTPGQTAGNWVITEHDFGYVPENVANKNASGGYAGLTLFKLNLRNALNTITSWFTTAATVARTWTMPDKDGTVAMTSDITGTNSGVNTGDQTITLTGNVTGSGTGSFATTIAASAVTLAMQANAAANSFRGNNTGAPAAPLDMTVAQAKTLLALAESDITGLAADLAFLQAAATRTYLGAA